MRGWKNPITLGRATSSDVQSIAVRLVPGAVQAGHSDTGVAV